MPIENIEWRKYQKFAWPIIEASSSCDRIEIFENRNITTSQTELKFMYNISFV